MEMGAKVAILEAITVAMVGRVALEEAMGMETGVRVEILEATTAMEVRVATLEEETTALGGTATTGMGVKEGLMEATMEMGIVSEETVTAETGVRVGTLGEGTTETVLGETAIMETEDRVEIGDK